MASDISSAASLPMPKWSPVTIEHVVGARARSRRRRCPRTRAWRPPRPPAGRPGRPTPGPPAGVRMMSGWSAIAVSTSVAWRAGSKSASVSATTSMPSSANASLAPDRARCTRCRHRPTAGPPCGRRSMVSSSSAVSAGIWSTGVLPRRSGPRWPRRGRWVSWAIAGPRERPAAARSCRASRISLGQVHAFLLRLRGGRHDAPVAGRASTS